MQASLSCGRARRKMNAGMKIREEIYESENGKHCIRQERILEMLVLSRRKDESIMIGDEVEVVIIEVRGNRVRLGITAPKSVPVHRKEVYEAIRKNENINI